ncbi:MULTISPECIES: ash family protein [Dickeya]|uniref:Prophage protein n=1 Tax=Dickeya fangzhongdai TaxID=1778540 RepID=A0A2K8QJI3_9GAMM|nr:MULTISPECIES: ash family protein [Dickeya]ATZ92890.1 hypothetical protein CVE23_02185 [Dickeya fangzhongdai]QOH46318.1 hypothetical protein DYD82_02210 [Dickeya fangzhongdai]QOH50625.1 hypothetical protein DYD83_02215 [Dickeya fangzhongdai]
MSHSAFLLAGKLGYTARATAKSVAGIGVPTITTVSKKHVHHVACFFIDSACAHLSMVAQAGAPKGAPEPVVAGYANPVWATTHGIGVSGGGCFLLTTEAALWLRPLAIPACNLSPLLWRCAMYNPTPLLLEEIADHCRVLAYAIIELENPVAKELLMFILWERLNLLNDALDAEGPDNE